MKYISLSILLIFSFNIVKGQRENLINDIESIKPSLPHKSTLVYVVMPWCSVAKEDIVAIAPAINTYRNNFNLILVVDSNYYKSEYGKYFKAVNDLKADKILAVNSYYPSGFMKKKEGKQLARLFNSYYPSGPYYTMGNSIFWLTDCNQNLLSTFTLYQKGLEPFEKELKELPKCE